MKRSLKESGVADDSVGPLLSPAPSRAGIFLPAFREADFLFDRRFEVNFTLFT